jgi:hypothetical protein
LLEVKKKKPDGKEDDQEHALEEAKAAFSSEKKLLKIIKVNFAIFSVAEFKNKHLLDK